MVDIVTRGSMVFFNAAFVTASGEPATPSTAKLYLAFTALDGTRTKTSVDMTVDGNTAAASWDSSVAAAPSEVVYSVKGTGSNAIVQDGSFSLAANEANPTS